MSFNKSFFTQFNRSLRTEMKKHKAFGAYKKVKFKRCNHKKAVITNGELRCPDCGAAWSGPRLIELYKKLGGKYGKDKRQGK